MAFVVKLSGRWTTSLEPVFLRTKLGMTQGMKMPGKPSPTVSLICHASPDTSNLGCWRCCVAGRLGSPQIRNLQKFVTLLVRFFFFGDEPVCGDVATGGVANIAHPHVQNTNLAHHAPTARTHLHLSHKPHASQTTATIHTEITCGNCVTTRP